MASLPRGARLPTFAPSDSASIHGLQEGAFKGLPPGGKLTGRLVGGAGVSTNASQDRGLITRSEQLKLGLATSVGTQHVSASQDEWRRVVADEQGWQEAFQMQAEQEEGGQEARWDLLEAKCEQEGVGGRQEPQELQIGASAKAHRTVAGRNLQRPRSAAATQRRADQEGAIECGRQVLCRPQSADRQLSPACASGRTKACSHLTHIASAGSCRTMLYPRSVMSVPVLCLEPDSASANTRHGGTAAGAPAITFGLASRGGAGAATEARERPFGRRPASAPGLGWHRPTPSA